MMMMIMTTSGVQTADPGLVTFTSILSKHHTTCLCADEQILLQDFASLPKRLAAVAHGNQGYA